MPNSKFFYYGLYLECAIIIIQIHLYYTLLLCHKKIIIYIFIIEQFIEVIMPLAQTGQKARRLHWSNQSQPRVRLLTQNAIKIITRCVNQNLHKSNEAHRVCGAKSYWPSLSLARCGAAVAPVTSSTKVNMQYVSVYVVCVCMLRRCCWAVNQSKRPSLCRLLLRWTQWASCY